MGNLVNAVHTKASEYFHIEDYQFLNKVPSGEALISQRESFLNQQIQLLEEQEKQFYNLIFPGTSDFNSFLMEFKRFFNNPKRQKDREIFKKFGSFNEEGVSLKQLIKDNLSLSFDSQYNNNNIISQRALFQGNKKKGTKALKPYPLALQENGRIISAAERRKRSQGTIDLGITDLKISFKIQLKGTKTKRAEKFDISEALDSVLTEGLHNNSRILSAEAYHQLIIETTKRINNIIDRSVYSPLTEGDVAWTFKDVFHINEDTLNKLFFRGLGSTSLITGAEFDATYDWVFAERPQLSAFQTTVSNQEEEIKTLLLVLIQDGSEYLQEAFDKVWGKYAQSFKTFNFQGTAIPGFLGEFAGALLFQYLTKNFSPTIVGSKTYEDWGEAMRSDIRLDSKDLPFGMQVKNWQKGTLDQKVLDVKLHPRQILQRLIYVDEAQKDLEELSILFANMSLNADIAKPMKTNQSLLNYLSLYLGYIGNFTTSGSIEEMLNYVDTSPLWLFGGRILVPGSVILRTLIRLLSPSNKSTRPVVSITVDSRLKGDEQFKDESSPNSSNGSPLFTDYWRHEKGSLSEWVFKPRTAENRVMNLCHKNVISTHVKFTYKNILPELQSAVKGQYTLF